jgi:hypothetical protein
MADTILGSEKQLAIAALLEYDYLPSMLIS